MLALNSVAVSGHTRTVAPEPFSIVRICYDRPSHRRSPVCAGPSSRPAECGFTSPKRAPADWPPGPCTARLAPAPLGVAGAAGRPAARPADHRARPARLRRGPVRPRTRLGQGGRRQRRVWPSLTRSDSAASCSSRTTGAVTSGYLMVLARPGAIRRRYLALNMGYPWVTARMLLPHVWRFAYQLPVATAGVPVQRVHPVRRTRDLRVSDPTWIAATARSTPIASAIQ